MNKKLIYFLSIIVLLLACKLPINEDKNCLPDGKKVYLNFKHLIRKDSLYYDYTSQYGELLGIISIVPNFDSVYIHLTNADIQDSFFRDRFNHLPPIPQTKLLGIKYIGYSQLIVCDFGFQPKWIKLQANKENLFYVYSTFAIRPIENFLYLELPLRIDNFQTEKTFAFSKGSHLSSITIDE